MVFEEGKLMAWIAEGYKHKLFASDARKDTDDADIRPCDSDSFVLLPEDETETFAELRMITPEPLKDSRRVKSATLDRTSGVPRRPGTAPAQYRSPYAKRSTISRTPTPSGQRPNSGKSCVSTASTSKLSPCAINKLRQGFTLVNKLYEKKYHSYKINLHPAGPDPDYRYFDRHTRCHGYTHMHEEMRSDTPGLSCDEQPCTGFSRPVSALSSVSQPSHWRNDPDSKYQPQRYMNYVRPRSSPCLRSGILSSSPVNRVGTRPRFCNIVKQAAIHEREKNEGYTDADYDYYRQYANGPLITRWRKHSHARDLDAGGTDGRPGSPSSHFGDGTEGVQRVNITGKPVSESDKDKKILTPGSTRSFTEDAQNTPIQPPPTPEPVSPKEDKDLLQELSKTDDNNENIDAGKDVLAELEKETESKKRPPIQKKERKTGNRTRTKKPEMEVKEKPIGATPPTATPNTQDESKKKDIKVDLDLPSLPTVETDKKKKKEKKKVEKHLITQPKHEEVPKDPEELIDDQIKQRIKTYEMNLVDVGSDDTPRKTMAKPAWVTGRLALSQQSSRFELPMDIVRLETMSVLDYIKEFCIITRRRKKLYTDIFNKHKDPKPNVIPIKELEKAIKSVLVNTITSEHYKEIAQMLDINENTKIDLPTFSAISALCERLLCTSFMISRDQVDMPQKEDIECADFSALDWKLSGVQVKPQMYKLLKQLS